MPADGRRVGSQSPALRRETRLPCLWRELIRLRFREQWRDGKRCISVLERWHGRIFSSLRFLMPTMGIQFLKLLLRTGKIPPRRWRTMRRPAEFIYLTAKLLLSGKF